MGYSVLSTRLRETANFICDVLGMHVVRHDTHRQSLDLQQDYTGLWSKTVFKLASGDLSPALEVVGSRDLEGYALEADGVVIVLRSSEAHTRLVKLGHAQAQDGGVTAPLPGTPCSVRVYTCASGAEELIDFELPTADLDRCVRHSVTGLQCCAHIVVSIC
jgi:hypothetical protein